MSKKLQVDAKMEGFECIGPRNIVEPDNKVVIGTIWRDLHSRAIAIQFSGNQWEGLDGNYIMDAENRLFDGDHQEILYYGTLIVFTDCIILCVHM